jgi:hypothetical protein
MTITKTLMLAAVSVLSIGVGAASARDLGPFALGFMSGTSLLAPASKAGVPAGSSDLGRDNHVVPFGQNYGTLANPG